MSTQTTANTKPQTTEIAFILDRSGSMQPHTEAASLLHAGQANGTLRVKDDNQLCLETDLG